MDHKILIGQRINLTSNKKGTLRYYGCVSFASGIWCGIELDEADGDNDGSVDNVYYFTCEKNHGIFCCISQVLSDFSLPGNVPFDEYIKFHQRDLLPDADKKVKKLSTISQESYVTSKPFENLSGLDVEINVPSASEDFVDTYEDSDESLGILSLDLLDDSNELFYENFLKDDSEHDFIDSIIKTNNPLMKLPDLSTSHSDELQCDLNAVNTIKFDEFKSAAIKINADKNCQSPKALLCSKFEESPTLKTVMSPKYSSTPKQDTTFVFDDRFFNSEQNLSPVSNLNKTYYKEDTLQDKIMLANIDKLNSRNVISVETPVFYPETDKNILNITCNISTLLHHQGKHNNTFNAANEMNVTIYPEDEKKTFILKENKRAEIQITPSDNEKDTTDENIQKVLNTNISLPDELGYKFEVLNLEECGNTSESTLNVLARPKDFENPLYEEGIMTNVFDKTQILNTTYEKIDELQLSKMNECSDVYKEVGMTNISKIAKSIDSSLFSNIAYIKSDKKSIRKNNFVSSKNNTKSLNKESLKRKQTFGSTPIKNDCNVIDQNLISQRTSDLSSCKSGVSLSHYNKFKFKEEKHSTVSLKSVSKQKKTSTEASKIFSELSFSQSKIPSEKTQVKLYGENHLQQKQLGETVTLTGKSIKQSIHSAKKMSNECEIQRPAAWTSVGKMSVPLSQIKMFQKIPTSTETQGMKVKHFGLPEKCILNQNNSSDRSVFGASYAIKGMQILNRKSSAIGSKSNDYQIDPTASKIPVGPVASKIPIRPVSSKILTTINRKTTNKEKVVAEKSKVRHLKISSRNLR